MSQLDFYKHVIVQIKFVIVEPRGMHDIFAIC